MSAIGRSRLSTSGLRLDARRSLRRLAAAAEHLRGEWVARGVAGRQPRFAGDDLRILGERVAPELGDVAVAPADFDRHRPHVLPVPQPDGAAIADVLRGILAAGILAA